MDAAELEKIYYTVMDRGDSMDIETILEKQRTFFASGATQPPKARIAALKRLREAIKRHEKDIAEALKEDLGKSDYEGYMCETGLALTEITWMIRHARSLSREKTVATPLAQFSSRSYVKPVPYGNVLIMSPWNYPFLLTIDPLADAIAAGNTAVLRRAPDPCGSGAWRQEPLYRGFYSGHRAGGEADRFWKILKLWPDLRRAGLYLVREKRQG